MTKKLTTTCLALGAAIVLAGAPSSAATIVLQPASPGPADTVHVAVHEDYESTFCWAILGTTCSVGSDDTLRITTQTQYCHGDPGCVCLAQPVELVSRCDFGPLAPGNWVILFTDVHVNPYDPQPTFSQTQAFTVDGPVPSAHRTWGSLKSVYR